MIKKIFSIAIILVILSSCTASFYRKMTSREMEQLELGMSKEQVIGILGKDYTISDKYTTDGIEFTTLSYREPVFEDEFYLFTFENNKLIKWNRELSPKMDARMK